jgi:hypothetical protein
MFRALEPVPGDRARDARDPGGQPATRGSCRPTTSGRSGARRARYQADFENQRRWLGWDLLCGLVGRTTRCAPLLRECGAPRGDARLVRRESVPAGRRRDQPLSDQRPLPARAAGAVPAAHATAATAATLRGRGGRARASDPPTGPAPLLARRGERYGLPIAVTEAAPGTRLGRSRCGGCSRTGARARRARRGRRRRARGHRLVAARQLRLELPARRVPRLLRARAVRRARRRAEADRARAARAPPRRGRRARRRAGVLQGRAGGIRDDRFLGPPRTRASGARAAHRAGRACAARAGAAARQRRDRHARAAFARVCAQRGLPCRC